jgi:GH15 family glucan-1,4-alpha-glucosidase
LKIEDYALIGDCHSAALVGRDGSIDWLCWPRFDSAACFAALLGGPQNGRWRLAPKGEGWTSRRAYRKDTLVLETEFSTATGKVAVVDFMPTRAEQCDLVRLVFGRSGRVAMEMELALRFDYGSTVPWVTRLHETHGIRAIAGPDLVALRTTVATHGEDLKTVARFEVGEGDVVPFVLAHQASHLGLPKAIDPMHALRETESYWREWNSRCTLGGEWQDAVRRSLITLKALTYAPTGGIVAAPTTSLPECIGSTRNWDYRFCWLRDATLTLLALMNAGYYDEAASWRDWLTRAIAGSPEQTQILYGIAGERRIAELEIGWLAGYEGSKPVRVGNAAVGQLQLDVYGEVMDALYQACKGGMAAGNEEAWQVQRKLMEHLEKTWPLPDEGIWEIRGARRHFTYSKMMAWVAVDRAIKSVESFGVEGPLERWRALRERIHADVCERGFDAKRNSFVQHYGSPELDASLLLMPITGFLPPDDPRVVGTVEAIRRELTVDGFVQRYRTRADLDGLPAGEGVFLACSFWLADNLKLQGRDEEARELFERLLALRNDVGLLAEEYDPVAKRFLGNFPQAFSHVALVNTAMNLGERTKPVEQRAEKKTARPAT